MFELCFLQGVIGRSIIHGVILKRKGISSEKKIGEGFRFGSLVPSPKMEIARCILPTLASCTWQQSKKAGKVVYKRQGMASESSDRGVNSGRSLSFHSSPARTESTGED